MPTEVSQISPWRRRSKIFVKMILGSTGLVIIFGQYRDARDLAKESYELWLSKFTHQVEYKKLAKLQVGITRQYLQKQLGLPKVIKPSSVEFGMTFEYYFHQKYLLTAFMKGERLGCYSLLSLEPTFKPDIPFAKKPLRSGPMGEIPSKPFNEYVSDVINIHYFLQQEPLDKSGMYMNRSIGVIQYQPKPGGFVDDLHGLAKIMVQGGLEQETKMLTRLNKSHAANFFALCELPLTVVADAVLTRYEYQQLKNRPI